MENFKNQGRSKRQVQSNQKVMVAGCLSFVLVVVLATIFTLIF